MNTRTTRPKAKTAVSAESENNTCVVNGTLTVKRHVCKDGTTSVYHQLQRWAGGRNVTVGVPSGQVDKIRRGIENFKRRKERFDAWAEAETNAALNPKPMDALEKKKNASASSANAAQDKPPKKPLKPSKR